MSQTHRCGRCRRPIIGGDAYQCGACAQLYHASCWISHGRCADEGCGSTTGRVVHVGPGGMIEVMAAPPPRRTPASPPPRANQGARRPSQGPLGPGPTGGADVELECPHCMLPVDSLDAPCPFCGRMPRSGRDVLVVDDEPRSDAAPWGVQTISVLNRVFAVFSWVMATAMLIPVVFEGELGLLITSAMLGSWGYLQWRMGGDLLKRKSWARTTQTVLSVLSLFGFPFGTVVGGLYLWGLHSSKAEDFFDNRPALPAARTPQLPDR